VEILEFLNNNAMVSVVQGEAKAPNIKQAPLSAKPPPSAPADEEKEAALGEEGGTGEAPPEEEKEGAAAEEGAPPARFTPPKSKPSSSSDSPPLSPLEKILDDKYGELGVRIYNLIDGEKTAEEILKETGVSEAKLVEILEFMDEQGIIKLEKPPEKEEAPEIPKAEFSSASREPAEEGGADAGEEEGEGGEAKEEPAQEPRFKPMIEEEPEETPFKPPEVPKTPPKEDKAKKIKEEIEEESKDIVPVDVPQMGKLSVVQQAMLFAELSTKFGKGARELMKMVDGSHDFIDLSLGTGMSFFDVDAIMAYFGKKGMVTFRQLDRDEIKKKYGEDGFAIYKRFGREGLLLYEMIGKEASLKDIIVKSKFDVDRALDILVFIHKVLGLDVPIDRDIIYKQLGMKK
jgi:transcription initiation factor IIE alpha subunit